MSISTVDYHTAGEPYRIVVGGVPILRGRTVLDKRADAQVRLDDVRRLLCNEPRGHADMYGCFITPPDDGPPDADHPGGPDRSDGTWAEFGMVFWHKDGFSTACGHGTIAGATWAINHGLVPATEPLTRFNLDVPSGRLAVEADVVNGRVGQVRFTNVPSAVRQTDIAVTVDGRTVAVDVAYGGAHYAILPAASVGLAVEQANVEAFVRLGRTIKAELVDHPAVNHPTDDRLSGLYGVIFFDDDPNPDTDRDGSPAALAQRNITVFADGEVDRSPCGSGTSARLAVLHHRGQLAIGHILSHRGISGGLFTGRVIRAESGEVVTQVGGRASPTGFHTFVLEPDDELGLGFQLR
ncbi:MAG: proline racemase family protein [Acidimicrobiia bacterium]|nr:proline racemase family protein [Acidimicrobiia bacterium]